MELVLNAITNALNVYQAEAIVLFVVMFLVVLLLNVNALMDTMEILLQGVV